MQTATSRRNFLKGALLAAAAGNLLPEIAWGQEKREKQAPSGRKPNFLFILADDLGSADVSWAGSEIRTPNLDRLMKAGVRLDAHYTTPVCSPTRAGLLTGRYWSRYGITVPDSRQCLPDGTPTLASVLKDAGYRTALVGKWHLGGVALTNKRPGLFGFDYSYGCLEGAANPFTHVATPGGLGGDDGKGVKTWHRNGQLIEEEGHVTNLIAREAIAFIRAAGDKPFFLYVPFTAPHKKCADTPEWLAKAADHVTDPKRRTYAAMVEHMDDAIGKIVAALDTDELRQNTLIVFASDNGGVDQGRNNPFRGHKEEVYEGGVRNLAFITWPGHLEPGQRTEPVCITDWMPTFCRLAGAAPKTDLKWDGQDLWPLLTAERTASAPQPRTIYLKGYRGESAALRSGDWKLVVNRRKKPEGVELYNLATDPAEKHNRAADEPQRVAELQEQLRAASSADDTAVAPEVRGKSPAKASPAAGGG